MSCVHCMGLGPSCNLMSSLIGVWPLSMVSPQDPCQMYRLDFPGCVIDSQGCYWEFFDNAYDLTTAATSGGIRLAWIFDKTIRSHFQAISI